MQAASSEASHDPTQWSEFRKWSVNLTACYVTFIVGLNATAPTAAVSETNDTFHVSDDAFPNSYWPVTAWNMGAALAPMVILPVMENYGMRPGYLACYLLFVLFVVPQAVARNFSTFIVCRFFAGCFAGVVQNVMDGIIADMWNERPQRSLPVSSYVFALLAGVSFGPVFGALISQSLDWRWIFYVQLIIYGTAAPLVYLLFHETRKSVIQSKITKKTRKDKSEPQSISGILNTAKQKWSTESLLSFCKDNVLRPAYLLVTEPVVFFFTLLSATSFGLLFMATQSVPQVYMGVYAFTEPQTGFIQASIVIGEGLGFLACAFVVNPYFAKTYAKYKTSPESSQLPEVRLHLAIPSLLIGLTGGLFIYGWTCFADISYWAPTVGLLLLGFGSMVVIQAITMYITDSYLEYAASATAAVVLGENVFAAFLPLATSSMYSTLGFHWASSLLAFIAALLSLAPIMMVWKGVVIRERSPVLKEMMNEGSAG